MNSLYVSSTLYRIAIIASPLTHNPAPQILKLSAQYAAALSFQQGTTLNSPLFKLFFEKF